MKGGHKLFVSRPRQAARRAAERAAPRAAPPARRWRRTSDVIITMVPDTPHVEAALFGKDGVAEGLSPGRSSST